MRPQKQTEFGPKGNCIPACVATILEIDLSEIPNWNLSHAPYTHWYPAFRDWCEGRGLGIFSVRYDVALDASKRLGLSIPTLPEFFGWFKLEGINVLACGLGPRTYKHATVYRDADLVWDPHPDGTGLVQVDEIYAVLPKSEADALYASALQRRR